MYSTLYSKTLQGTLSDKNLVWNCVQLLGILYNVRVLVKGISFVTNLSTIRCSNRVEICQFSLSDK